MNDLLKRYPKNKHVLYLTSEWLFLQQDFDRSQKMMEGGEPQRQHYALDFPYDLD
jgi:hypothetical protein